MLILFSKAVFSPRWNTIILCIRKQYSVIFISIPVSIFFKTFIEKIFSLTFYQLVFIYRCVFILLFEELDQIVINFCYSPKLTNLCYLFMIFSLFSRYQFISQTYSTKKTHDIYLKCYAIVFNKDFSFN